jgi:hypothetical protein
MYNVLAEAERDCGAMPAAIEAACEAYRKARRDGPPHAYKRALDKAKALLDAFGAPYPAPSPRDSSDDDIFPQIPRPKTGNSAARREHRNGRYAPRPANSPWRVCRSKHPHSRADADGEGTPWQRLRQDSLSDDEGDGPG